jgi:hypothetical protein
MPKHQYRYFRIAWLALAIGCGRDADKTDRSRTTAPSSAPVAQRTVSLEASAESRYAVGNSMPGIREPHVRKGSEITELFSDSTSAYAANLAVDDDVVYLLTDTVAYRFVPGSDPKPLQIPIDNGGAAAVTRSGIVYWSKGSLWKTPKTGGKAQRLADVDHQPQFLMAAGEDIAWLDMPVRDQFLIQTLDGRRPRTLLSYEGRIETATMDTGRVLFVRRDGATAWSIGGVSLRDGKAIYAAPKSGPHPAKLAVAGDVYYYDVGSNEVRRLSPDLAHEVTVTRDFSCSPIAVSVRIYCPNMDGMFELARHAGAKLMPLFPSTARITSVAASSRFLVWLNDTGASRLSLKMIRLALDDEP